jgi:hypothetical protein
MSDSENEIIEPTSKPTRKPMSAERKAALLANLARGRKKAAENRAIAKAKAEKTSSIKNEIIATEKEREEKELAEQAKASEPVDIKEPEPEITPEPEPKKLRPKKKNKKIVYADEESDSSSSEEEEIVIRRRKKKSKVKRVRIVQDNQPIPPPLQKQVTEPAKPAPRKLTEQEQTILRREKEKYQNEYNKKQADLKETERIRNLSRNMLNKNKNKRFGY